MDKSDLLLKDKTITHLPLISIVTVVYNGEDSIRNTIESCINQSYPNIEYIVIDGKSNDSTVEIISKFNNQISYFISEPDLGIYDAMNKAIKVAKGEWINFMNSGDVFVNNNVIDSLINIISNDKSNADIIYGNTIFKFKDFFLKQKPMNLDRIKREMAFCHQSTFVKMSLIKVSVFNLNYKLAADFEMMNRFYRENRTFKYIDMYISIFDQIDGSTLRNFKLSIKERFLIYDDMGPMKKRIIYFKTVLRMLIGISLRNILPEKYKNHIFILKNKSNILNKIDL